MIRNINIGNKEKKTIEQIKKFFDYLRKNFNLNHRNINEDKKSL